MGRNRGVLGKSNSNSGDLVVIQNWRNQSNIMALLRLNLRKRCEVCQSGPEGGMGEIVSHHWPRPSGHIGWELPSSGSPVPGTAGQPGRSCALESQDEIPSSCYIVSLKPHISRSQTNFFSLPSICPPFRCSTYWYNKPSWIQSRKSSFTLLLLICLHQSIYWLKSRYWLLSDPYSLHP